MNPLSCEIDRWVLTISLRRAYSGKDQGSLLMTQSTIRDFASSHPALASTRFWKISSIAASLAAIVVSATAIPSSVATAWGLLPAITVLAVIALVHVRFLALARDQHHQSDELVFSKNCEFQSVFENASDAILVFDGNGTCLDANPASVELLGSQRSRIVGKSVRTFYSNPIEFDVLRQHLVEQQRFQGEWELVRSDGATVFAEFTVASHFLPNRHLMILRDTTSRRKTQLALSQSLVVARSSSREADALRRATLALTEELQMDRVLETLLETLAQFVPYEHAQVYLFESGSRLFLAREAAPDEESPQGFGFPESLEISEFPILMTVFEHPEGLLIKDSSLEADSGALGKDSQVRSWIVVPITSSSQVLGFFSLAHSDPSRFSRDHLRLTRSLANPAAAAIRNARLHERAEIYAMELKSRIQGVEGGEPMLEEAELRGRISDESFHTLFRRAPVAMAVTSLTDGKFIDVNEAFARRFGIRTDKLWGPASAGFWENPHERKDLIDRLLRGTRVRAEVARLRLKSGMYEATLFSAELVNLDGRQCLLVATQDSPDWLTNSQS